MAKLFDVLRNGSRYRPNMRAMSDGLGSITGRDLVTRVSGLAAILRDRPQTLGLLGAHGIDWAVAQLAAWAAGKTVVPMPAFFSRLQLEHILRDAGIDHVIVTREAAILAKALKVDFTSASQWRPEPFPHSPEGAGAIVYTSGSTGRPKGVRFGIEQIDRQAQALAAAIGAAPDDSYLSVLPLALLLETITAICVPVLVGAQTHFAAQVAESVASGRPSGLLKAFEESRPTTSVLVPQLLSVWIDELERYRKRAPDSLRFIAVGGAHLSEALGVRAWELGIPAYQGYGLTECCSVVAVNRPGCLKLGTAGQILPGLDVTIEDGEIVVRGPTIMAGYLHGAPVSGAWRTGDLGSLTDDGFLSVAGRRDSLLVLASGRNISPEWIEAMILSDSRVLACVALGHGMNHLSVLLIPSAGGERWLAKAPRAHVLLWLEQICAQAPSYAVPKDFIVCPAAQAKQLGLLASSGRITRGTAATAYPALKLASRRAAAWPNPHRMEEKHRAVL